MRFDNEQVICEGIESESFAMPLKMYLEGIAPAKVIVDLTECKDMHTAVAQLFIAYAGIYGAEYRFGDINYAYKLLLQGASIAD